MPYDEAHCERCGHMVQRQPIDGDRKWAHIDAQGERMVPIIDGLHDYHAPIPTRCGECGGVLPYERSVYCLRRSA